MATNPNRALTRLMGKLSALRLTLRKDERDLLDELILGARVEVAAHAMNAEARVTKIADKHDKKASSRTTHEVEAHRMDGAVAKQVVGRLTARIDSAPEKRINKRISGRGQPEVVAHRMDDKAAATAMDKKLTARLDWDADKKLYRVNID